jgi:UDP-N-acetylenolpyruvoylglucosamine reductase
LAAAREKLRSDATVRNTWSSDRSMRFTYKESLFKRKNYRLDR